MIRATCANAYLGGENALCRVLGRYKMRVDTTDVGLSGHLLLDGHWEMWVVEAMIDRIRPGMTVVDAGANLGYFTMLMADLVGPGGHVHAFEPNARIAMRLRHNVDMNGFASRTTIHEVALSDRAGLAAIMVPDNEPKNGHVIDDVDRPGAIPIRLERFDAVAALAGADFVKIDVEGSEERLWAGMAGLLANGRPMTVLLEFTAGRYSDPRAFAERMIGAGFALSHLTMDEGIVPLTVDALLSMPAHEDQMILLER